MNAAFCVSLLACAAGPAAAQPEVLGTWLWEVTTQDGDAVVEPGETATFTLSMDFSPDVGERGLTGKQVSGLANILFDTIGTQNADKGVVVGWQILSNLDVLHGDTTTTDGTSLFGTMVGQIGLDIVHDDPIEVIAVEWEPLQYATYEVLYQTFSTDFLVWEGEAEELEVVEWPVAEAAIYIQVVPAPSGAVLVLSLAALRSRRRN